MYCFLCFTRPLHHHKSSNLLRRTRLDGAVEHAEVRILHLFILCFRYPWQRGDLEVTQEWTGGIYIARQFQEGKVTAFSCLSAENHGKFRRSVENDRYFVFLCMSTREDVLSLICYQPLDLPPFATLATDQITVTWSCIVPHHLRNRLDRIIWVRLVHLPLSHQPVACFLLGLKWLIIKSWLMLQLFVAVIFLRVVLLIRTLNKKSQTCINDIPCCRWIYISW